MISFRTAPGRAAVYGAIHALIDAACVTSVYRAIPAHRLDAETAFAIVLGYDLLAFGSQALFGAAADRWRAARAALLAGIAATALAVGSITGHAPATMFLAGIGNALFHVGAGALVLAAQPGKAAPAGIFVAPGALGLAAGVWIGRDGGLERLWFFIPLLAVAFLAALLMPTSRTPGEEAGAGREKAADDLLPFAVVALFMLSICVRSFVGMGAAYRCPKDLMLMLGVPSVAFGGKALGGLLADRLGWLRTAVGALLLSAPLIAFGGGTAPVVLAGLFLFQMTMPVTLAGTALAMPGRPATAFGLTCLALIAGAWPTFFPGGRAWYGPAVFLVLIAASALALFAGLRLLKTLGDRSTSGVRLPRGIGVAESFDRPA